MINLQNADTRKIQLTIAINFISSKYNEEERVMHLSNVNVEFTTYIDANDVIEKKFNSLHSIYQDGLETSMKGSDYFLFSSTNILRVS